MNKINKFTTEEKLKIVTDYIVNGIGMNTLAQRTGVNKSSIRGWIILYKTFGANGLKHNTKKSRYSTEFKCNVVKKYMSGTMSLVDICIKYKIKSKTQLISWISLYNKGKLMKFRGSGSVRIKGIRKNLTFEDRVEVVKYYLEISKNYSETAIKFQVSYQQVYQWVQKYNKSGVNGLIDKRGKRKTKEELTEIEKLKLNIKLLKAQNRRMELENAFLKKLNELEGV